MRIVVGAVLVALLAATPTPADAARRTTTEATLNVYRANPPADVTADVRAAMRRATVVRLQETYPRAWRAARAALSGSWRIMPGPRTELTTIYDRQIWTPVRVPRFRRMPDVERWEGPRWLAWQAMRFRATGQVVRIANVHADPGCGTSGRAYLDAVRVWTHRALDVHPSWPVLLGGDTNCRPWLLRRLYRPDDSATVDKLVTSRGPGAPRTLRRWSLPARSDHRLELRAIRFR